MKQPLTNSAIQAPKARLRSFENFYLFLVIGCAFLCAVSVAIAVYVKVLYGVLAAILTALIYRYCLGDELKKQLGLSQHRVADGLAVTVTKRVNDETILSLPQRLLWLDVVEFHAVEKDAGNGIVELELPATLQRIASDALSQLPDLQTIRFCGTQEQWESVQKPDLSAYHIILK